MLKIHNGYWVGSKDGYEIFLTYNCCYDQKVNILFLTVLVSTSSSLSFSSPSANSFITLIYYAIIEQQSDHRLHRYTEVRYLKLIWLSRKWQVLKENLIFMGYCKLMSFSLFLKLLIIHTSRNILSTSFFLSLKSKSSFNCNSERT